MLYSAVCRIKNRTSFNHAN